MWLRLHEKGGKHHEMPVHHNLEEYLDSYIDAAGLWEDKKGSLFRASIAKLTSSLKTPSTGKTPFTWSAGVHEKPVLRPRSAATPSGQPVLSSRPEVTERPAGTHKGRTKLGI
jgi:hypothetical protein